MTQPLPEIGAKPGCLPLASLFIGVWFAGAMTAMFAYILVVEQLSLITVRREFSYDMAFLWSPLFGLIAAFALTFWALRRDDTGRKTALWAILAGAVALLLLFLFIGLGTII